MYSNIVPFESVVEQVKSETGITNLRNLYPRLRKFIYQAEKDLGFGDTILLKRLKYSVANGSIVVDGNNRRIKLPEDWVYIHETGSCSQGLCPGDYNIQGNWMFICKPINELNLIYYTLLCDGHGNPVLTENHFEAVAAKCSWELYKPKVWNGEGSRAVLRDLKQYYFDRLGEAIGNDIMPSTRREFEKLGQILRMSSRDIFIFDAQERCFCSVPGADAESLNENNMNNATIYHWQYNNLTDDISLAPDIDQSFLDSQNTIALNSFMSGTVFDYNNIGRIAFAIKGAAENFFRITDVLNADVTDIVFDSYYDSEQELKIWISKEYYTHSNIYFKLIENPNP